MNVRRRSNSAVAVKIDEEGPDESGRSASTAIPDSKSIQTAQRIRSLY